MQQCNFCHRFVNNSTIRCPFCNSDNFEPFKSEFKLSKSKDHKKYTTEIDSLHINNQPYKILELIDMGGVSTILKIGDRKNNFYALKVPILFDEEFSNMRGNSSDRIGYSLKYIRDEIDNLKRLEGESITKIYYKGDISITHRGKTVSIPVIQMELAETTLAHIIYNISIGKNRISIQEKEKIISDILHCLKNIHQNKFTHRDLSPDNIFVVNRDGEIRYIIADFGTTKLDVDQKSSEMLSDILVHRPYTDPLRFHDPVTYRNDQRSDIYSVGIILTDVFLDNFWTNLIDCKMNVNEIEEEFEKNILNQHLKDALDKDILKIIRKATKRKADDRYQKTEQFLKDIKKYFKKIHQRDHSREGSLTHMNLYLQFQMKTPVKIQPEQAADITYDGNNNIKLGGFKNHRLCLNNRSIKKVEVIGSRLFTASHDRNTVHLNINSRVWEKYSRKFDPILQQSRGCLDFAFQLKIHFVKL